MSTKIAPKMTGIALAMAAAGLMASCAGNQPASSSASAGNVDLVQCSGVNACKGHNDCKSAKNACAGKASCKGMGFVATTVKSCGDIGGKSGA